MQEQFKHCIIDLGDKAEQRPDILVFEPETFEDEKHMLHYDLTRWSENITAIEVETDPTKHANQITINYKKNFEKGFDIWFVVFSEKHGNYICNVLEKDGIDRSLYQIMTIDAESVIEFYANMDKSSSATSLDETESQVVAKISETDGGATAQKISNELLMSVENVLNTVKSLEQKNILESQSYEKSSKTTYYKHNEIRKRTDKKDRYQFPLLKKKPLKLSLK